MEFIETPLFEKSKEGIFDEDELQRFQLELLEHPDAGDLIPKGKGLRKIRWSASGRGKRGGGACHILLDKRGKHDFSAFGI